jgi:hypothetical protein
MLDDGGELSKKCPRNHFEMGQIKGFWSRQSPAGRVRIFGSGTNAEKDRSSGNWRYTVVARKAKWEFRSKGQSNFSAEHCYSSP